MTTSGTTAFNPDVATLIEEAFDRAGYEGRSGYEYRTAARSLNFLMAEWSNLGLNLWAVDEGSISIVSGQGQYDLPADTVDIIDQVWRVNNTDYRLERIGVGSWAAISSKTQQNAKPNQVYVERLLTPRINLWPVPTDTTAVFHYWRLRRIQDAGTADKTMDVPYRFLSALTAGLAYKLAMKKKPFDQVRVQALQADYQEQIGLAMSEDRGREPFRIFVRTK